LLSIQRVFRTWWPLAGSWLLMSLELPALSAVIARMPDPEINLAAYGGIVFPLALIIESPIIMFLAASTALSKDWASFIHLRRYMNTLGAALTVLHFLVAFTPLFDIVVKGVMGAPSEIVEPARIGLRIMIPWSWSIGFRRFHQGVLIRFNRSQSVGTGTIVRLGANIIVLLIGFSLGNIPGIVVATSAVATGVTWEALYAWLAARPVLNGELRQVPPVTPVITRQSFLAFYIPLILTSLLTLLVNPIGSAALSRMPLALESLAAWSVMAGLIFMFRSLGMAYNEVVVALLDEAGSWPVLLRYTFLLSSLGFLGLLLVIATPLAGLWFGQVSALSQDLVRMALPAMWLALPLPALTVLQSWFQGNLLHSRQTRVITESVALFLVVCTAILAAGVVWGKFPGLMVGWTAFTLATIAQTAWLWLRSRPVLRKLSERDRLFEINEQLVEGTQDKA
jgi:hypothetical protein